MKRKRIPRPKRQATRNEYRSIALLKAQGYSCSRVHGGLWQVVGVREDDIVLVRVCGEEPDLTSLLPFERVLCPPDVRRIVHVWKPRKRKPETREL